MVRRDRAPAYLLNVFSSFEMGGAQVRFAAIANHFGRHYRHSIMAMDGNYANAARLRPDLDVTIETLPPSRGTLTNRRNFRAVLRSRQPSCLITYNWGAIEWAMANVPNLVRHIHIEDGFGPEESDRQLLRRVLARRLLLRRSTVVVPSRKLESIATGIWKLSRSSVRYIPNGIDCARFSQTGISSLPERDGRLTIGTVAALRAEKNLVRMMDAFRLVRERCDCRLVIAGDGPVRAELEAYSAKLGLAPHVTFTGNRTDVERVYAALDIFLLSSDTEQMPTAVIEAMASGLPVVATDVGDVAGMVARENAPFVVPMDANALARATLSLLADESLRRRVGAENRIRALRKYSDTAMFAAYGELFEPDGTGARTHLPGVALTPQVQPIDRS